MQYTAMAGLVFAIVVAGVVPATAFATVPASQYLGNSNAPPGILPKVIEQQPNIVGRNPATWSPSPPAVQKSPIPYASLGPPAGGPSGLPTPLGPLLGTKTLSVPVPAGAVDPADSLFGSTHVAPLPKKAVPTAKPCPTEESEKDRLRRLRSQLRAHLRAKAEASARLKELSAKVKHMNEKVSTEQHMRDTKARFHKEYLNKAEDKVMEHEAETEHSRTLLAKQLARFKAKQAVVGDSLRVFEDEKKDLDAELSTDLVERSKVEGLLKMENSLADGVQDTHQRHLTNLTRDINRGRTEQQKLSSKLSRAQKYQAHLNSTLAAFHKDYRNFDQAEAASHATLDAHQAELARVKEELRQTKETLRMRKIAAVDVAQHAIEFKAAQETAAKAAAAKLAADEQARMEAEAQRVETERLAAAKAAEAVRLEQVKQQEIAAKEAAAKAEIARKKLQVKKLADLKAEAAAQAKQREEAAAAKEKMRVEQLEAAERIIRKKEAERLQKIFDDEATEHRILDFKAEEIARKALQAKITAMAKATANNAAVGEAKLKREADARLAAHNELNTEGAKAFDAQEKFAKDSFAVLNANNAIRILADKAKADAAQKAVDDKKAIVDAQAKSLAHAIAKKKHAEELAKQKRDLADIAALAAAEAKRFALDTHRGEKTTEEAWQAHLKKLAYREKADLMHKHVGDKYDEVQKTLEDEKAAKKIEDDLFKEEAAAEAKYQKEQAEKRVQDAKNTAAAVAEAGNKVIAEAEKEAQAAQAHAAMVSDPMNQVLPAQTPTERPYLKPPAGVEAVANSNLVSQSPPSTVSESGGMPPGGMQPQQPAPALPPSQAGLPPTSAVLSEVHHVADPEMAAVTDTVLSDANPDTILADAILAHSDKPGLDEDSITHEMELTGEGDEDPAVEDGDGAYDDAGSDFEPSPAAFLGQKVRLQRKNLRPVQ